MTSKKAALGITLALTATLILWLAVACGNEVDPDYQCGTESLEQANKTHEVYHKYKPLFERYISVQRAFLRDEKTGRRTESWGILISVHRKIDQGALEFELEGVPVQIISGEIVSKGEDFQGGGAGPDDINPQPHSEIAWAVWNKHRDLFRRHPFSSGSLMLHPEAGSEPGEAIFGVEVFVTEHVDPETRPLEDRIPDCLEDVPVKITVRP